MVGPTVESIDFFVKSTVKYKIRFLCKQGVQVLIWSNLRQYQCFQANDWLNISSFIKKDVGKKLVYF